MLRLLQVGLIHARMIQIVTDGGHHGEEEIEGAQDGL